MGGEAMRKVSRLSRFNIVSLALGLAFLYLPILILVIYSFNDSRLVTVWGGWSLRWYHEFFNDRAMIDAAWMSLRVAARLEAQHGIRCRVVDMRWLAPMPVDDMLEAASACGRTLVVDETRKTGGVSEGVFTALIEGGYRGRLARVTGHDTFIPLGPAANLVLVQEEDIERAALALMED